MELQRLEYLINQDKTKAVDKIKAVQKLDEKIDDYIKQYDPCGHDVLDENIRKKNKVDKPDGPEYIEVNRIAVPIQKMIVSRAAQFLAGNPIKLDYTTQIKEEQQFMAAIQKIWTDNKLDYKTKQIIKRTMSETECAEIWYKEESSTDFWNDTIVSGASNTVRMRIVARSLKDELYPVFDAMENLVAFGRAYKVYNEEDELADAFDIYTASFIYEFRQTPEGWIMKPIKNYFSKIPVIYYYQEKPEWADVQTMISRFETLLSNHADTNDRVGSPIVKVTGELIGTDQNQLGQVKVFKMKAGGDIEYVTWDAAPESIKLEIEQLWKLIHVCSDTPDTSTSDEKGLGQVSGVALEMRFLNAHLKAADKEEIYGEYLQRRINFLKSALVSIKPSLKKYISLPIRPLFDYYMPKNDVEKIDLLVTAVQAKILSPESAVRQNPLVQDAEAELKLLQSAEDTTPEKIDEEINQQ